MTELEKVLAGLLLQTEVADVILVSEIESAAKFLAPHVERAFRQVGHGFIDTPLDWAVKRGTESLREALNDD